MSIEEVKQSIENSLGASSEIDYVQLNEQVTTITVVSEVILGFLSTIIMVMVPFIVSVEVIYICFPVIRQKMNDLVIKVESKGVAHSVLEITLRDARKAVEDSFITMPGERSALWIYLTIKVKSIMFMMLLVVTVIKGGASVIETVWNVIGNAVDLIF